MKEGKRGTKSAAVKAGERSGPRGSQREAEIWGRALPGAAPHSAPPPPPPPHAPTVTKGGHVAPGPGRHWAVNENKGK